VVKERSRGRGAHRMLEDVATPADYPERVAAGCNPTGGAAPDPS